MKFPLVGPPVKILKAMGSVTGIMKLYGRQQSLHSNHICLLLTENLSYEMHCDLCYLDYYTWFDFFQRRFDHINHCEVFNQNMLQNKAEPIAFVVVIDSLHESCILT